MARLIIRVKPNDHPTDSSLTPLRTRVGDVVDAREDGHVFSLCERTNGQYRIIDIPGVTVSQIEDLITAVVDATGKMTARRAFALDPTTLSGTTWRNRTSATLSQIQSITIARS